MAPADSSCHGEPVAADDGRSLDQHPVTALTVREGKVYKMGSYLSAPSNPSKIALHFGRST